MKGKVIFLGFSGSPGTAIGHVRVFEGDIGQVIGKCDAGDILVCNRWRYDSQGLNSEYLKKAAALVQNIGGSTSNGAIVCRELAKPCILGAADFWDKKATDALNQGMKVIVEGHTGDVDVVDENGQVYRKIPYGTVYQFLPDLPGEAETSTPAGIQPKPLLRPRPSQQPVAEPFDVTEFLKEHGQKPNSRA